MVTKRLQRQNEGKARLESDISHDKKEGQKHNEAGLDAKELRKRYDRQGKIDVFLAKSGTKVHLIRGCSGLNAADFTRIQTRTLCGNCFKNQRRFTRRPRRSLLIVIKKKKKKRREEHL